MRTDRGSARAGAWLATALGGCASLTDDYADLGNGGGYEWLGWVASPFIELHFATPRDVNSVTIGINRNDEGGLQPPVAIVISVWDAATGYHPKVGEYEISVQNEKRSEITITFQGALVEWLGIDLTPTPGSWLLIDEVTVGP